MKNNGRASGRGEKKRGGDLNWVITVQTRRSRNEKALISRRWDKRSGENDRKTGWGEGYENILQDAGNQAEEGNVFEEKKK